MSSGDGLGDFCLVCNTYNNTSRTQGYHCGNLLPMTAPRAQPNGALHADTDKLPLQYLPHEALEECAAVMQWATKKAVPYTYDNWRKGMPWMKLCGSILRHVFAFLRGEDLDSESGHQHLAHAALDCLYLVTYGLQKLGTDDRDTARSAK